MKIEPKRMRAKTEDIINSLKHMAYDHPCCCPAANDAIIHIGQLEECLEEILRANGNGYGGDCKCPVCCALRKLNKALK